MIVCSAFMVSPGTSPSASNSSPAAAIWRSTLPASKALPGDVELEVKYAPENPTTETTTSAITPPAISSRSSRQFVRTAVALLRGAPMPHPQDCVAFQTKSWVVFAPWYSLPAVSSNVTVNVNVCSSSTAQVPRSIGSASTSASDPL